MPKAYAYLNQLKDPGYLNLNVTTYDSTLLRILENASEDIDHLCFRHFDTIEGTIYADGSSRTLIPTEDILSISRIDLDLDGSQTWASTLTISDYFLYPLNSFSPYPKLYLKMSINCAYGGFAPGMQSGVRLTGVFGHGDGYSTTPYSASGAVVNTGGITNVDTSHALASGSGALFSPGMTIRIDTEQLYITSISTDTIYFNRGVNGTTAAAHLAAAVISVYKYPGPVVESTLILAANWWKQRENPTTFKTGNSLTGEYQITEDIEKILTKRLSHHIKRKLI